MLTLNDNNTLYLHNHKKVYCLYSCTKAIVKKQKAPKKDKENMNTPVDCRCGRAPEENTETMGYNYSFSCKCGGEEINFVTRSDNQQVALDNWESLIRGTPYKHHVIHMPNPHSTPEKFRVPDLDQPYDSDPLRRYIRERGGHCSGGGGCS